MILVFGKKRKKKKGINDQFKCISHNRQFMNKLLENFSCKFDDSRNNKVLVDEFVKKYEQAALNHKSNNVLEFNVEYIGKFFNELK